MSPSSGPSQDKQKTIKNPFSLFGIGLHSGVQCSASFRPADVDVGIFFVHQNEKIPARADLVSDTTRGTSLSKIQVVEHVLAAIYGLGINNLEIELSQPELPILDGSALPYVSAFKNAGLIDQGKNVPCLSISSPIKINDGSASLEVLPYDGFKINFMLYFPYLGKQEFVFFEHFEDEIAPARTFGLIDDLDLLRSRGLAQGASYDNALAIGQNGYLNPPRFSNEPVRHKILDLIGDLALVGRSIKGEIFAVKSGHKLNVELARRLLVLC